MPITPYVSTAPDRQDVVLRRALGHLSEGRYLDATARRALDGAVTEGLSAAGWTGTAVLPAGRSGAEWQERRPADVVVDGSDAAALAAGAAGAGPTHVAVVAAGDPVLAPVLALEPWVVVLVPADDAALVPETGAWVDELAAAGYEGTLFDGVSRFYVAHDRVREVGPALAYPACRRDHYVDASVEALRAERDELVEDLLRWRTRAIEGWTGAGPGAVRTPLEGPELAELFAARQDLADIRRTLSWRVTKPLRAVRSLTGGRRS